MTEAIIVSGEIKLCYSAEVLSEYIEVLRRPRFGFNEDDVSSQIGLIKSNGLSITPPYLEGVSFVDDDDRPFYELGKYCACPIVTCNKRHFPKDELVMSPKEFIDYFITK